jgi:hypothetical protein
VFSKSADNLSGFCLFIFGKAQPVVSWLTCLEFSLFLYGSNAFALLNGEFSFGQFGLR